MSISIKKGLNIPMAGKPSGPIQKLPSPSMVALNLDPFPEIRFRVHTRVGDVVKMGQPLIESKSTPGQAFVSPAGGVVKEIRRGLKRRLLNIVIEVAEKEEYEEENPLNLAQVSREEILSFLMRRGAFPHIRLRPFDLVADPGHIPRAIFVKALESAPFVPSAEMQVEGHERDFQTGLDTLAKLTDGKVHLVFWEKTPKVAFTEAKGVEKHPAKGPHPVGNHSVHIHHISPISHPEDYVWTLTVVDVITIGKLVSTGRYYTDRILSIAGNGIIEGRGGYFKGRLGFPVGALISNRIKNEWLRFISGDPLTGFKVETQDFLGFYHTTFTVIPQNSKRQLFHFFRPGFGKYSATKTYVTGHMPSPDEGYAFTTNQHGEERAFVDGSVYNKVMPMRIPTMELLKSILSEDFELAETLGILEVASEDFALPTFICPSKIEMIEIVKQGLHRYSKEMGH